ncbi:MAG: hypothetical protein ACK4KT_09375 [Thermaurantimonas sp.]
MLSGAKQDAAPEHKPSKTLSPEMLTCIKAIFPYYQFNDNLHVCYLLFADLACDARAKLMSAGALRVFPSMEQCRE